jgi:sulfate transport system ATP-binding protein
MSIVIKNIKKSFGNFDAVDDVSFQVHEGEFLALLGPSGSGKTSLLRIIAGLETADGGEIYLEGVDASGKPIMERKIGFVFQHFALFKHMTVFDNIAFGLRLKRPKLTEAEIRDRVNDLLKFVHLEGLDQKHPANLSGGQRQRVALARVLAVEPKYLLLDEPFGALDARVRKELRRWLRKLHETSGLTTIFVTHDQEEAMEMADRIAILNKGKLVEIATPLELWKNPVNSFVYDFLGNYNTFRGVELPNQGLAINPQYLEKASETKPIKVFSRPHETILKRTPSDTRFYIQGRLNMINQTGPMIKTELESPSEVIYQVDMDNATFETLQPKLGETFWIKPTLYRSFDE